MSDLFYTVLNMSITGSYVIIAVIFARLLLKRLPKKYSYALWVAAAFRLCCPISFQSVFSLFSLKPFDMSKAQNGGAETLQYINSDFVEQTYPRMTTGISNVNTVIYEEITTGARFISFKDTFMKFLPYIWLAVLCAMLIYGFAEYIKMKQKMRDSILLKDNIYQTDKISSPFILGIIKPKIYIPFGLDDDTEKYVLEHERFHLKRFDHIIKSFAYVILCIHWFNPLCWIAFHFMSRDMEMSCDEKVLSNNGKIKKDYSNALLSFVSERHFPTGSPLSFCESGVKKRIKNILSYKKPAVWLSAFAVILIAAITVGCAANPKAPALIEKPAVSSEVSYTAGRTIFQSPLLSSIIEDGGYYANIKADKNSLEIADINGDTIFKSANVSNREFTRNELIKYFSNIPYADGTDLSNEILPSFDKITECTYTDNHSTLFTVYWYNNDPIFIAENIGTMSTGLLIHPSRIYEMLPNTNNLESAISREILNYHNGKYLDGRYKIESHYTLRTQMGSINNKNDRTCLTAFVYRNYGEFDINNDLLDETSGSAGYAAITFNIDDDGQFSLKEYWEPRDGGLLLKDLNRVFPEGIIDNFEDIHGTVGEQLIKNNFSKAIEASNFNTDKAIEKLFADIENNKEVAYSSVPGDYINASTDKYNLLMNYGDYTLKYIYKEFFKGNVGGMKDNLMWIVLKDLAPNEVLKTVCYSGQEYFNAFYDHAIRMYELNDEEYMKEFEPAAWILIEMDYIK